MFPNFVFFFLRVNPQNNFSYPVEIPPMKTYKIQSNIAIRWTDQNEMKRQLVVQGDTPVLPLSRQKFSHYFEEYLEFFNILQNIFCFHELSRNVQWCSAGHLIESTTLTSCSWVIFYHYCFVAWQQLMHRDMPQQ